MVRHLINKGFKKSGNVRVEVVTASAVLWRFRKVRDDFALGMRLMAGTLRHLGRFQEGIGIGVKNEA